MKTTTEDAKALYWLGRAVSESKTLMFMMSVRATRNEHDDMYSSTIPSLEAGTVTGVGPSPNEAFESVVTLFQEMVDACIEGGDDLLSGLIGDSGIMREFDVSLAEAGVIAREALEATKPRKLTLPRLHAARPEPIIPRWFRANPTAQPLELAVA